MIVDSPKDVYISQPNFTKYIAQTVFDCLLEDKRFIKANIILDTLNEGYGLLQKLHEIDSKIESEEKRYPDKAIQDYNATLRHLRENKKELYEILESNKSYQDFLNFDFYSLENKILEISEADYVSFKNSKNFYKTISSRFFNSLLSEIEDLFFSENPILKIKPILIYKKPYVDLSLNNGLKDNLNVLIGFSEIEFSKNIFEAYKNIPKNIASLKEKTENSPAYLKSLNESQRYAATYPLEHILVLAGAGCGKTTTIISRASYLISKGISPERILILTFTRKAAFEIVTRIEKCLDKQSYGIKACTFHRWCIDILKTNPKIFGYENFTLIDRDEQLQIFKRIRTSYKDNRLPKSAKMLDAYSFARNTRKSLSEVIFEKLFDYSFAKEKIAEMMKSYEEEKRIKNYLDYDDILDIVASSIQQNKDVCKWLAEKYDCILVDEMQDTNPLQWNLLEPLSKYTKLFCVGDDAQAIYGFRGADFNNIHSFQERIPNSVIIKLEDNYRSTQEILDLSNWLLKSSQIKYDKELKAVLGNGEKPYLHTFVNIFEESLWIAEDLMQRYKKDKIWNNKLVLVRSAYSGRNIEVECLRHSIPYVFIGGQKLLESAHIKDLLSLLRLSENYKDELAWYRFLTLFPGIGDVTANKIISKIIACASKEEVNNLLRSTLIENCGIKTVYEHLIQEENLESKIDISISFMDEILMLKFGKNEWTARRNDFVYLKQLSSKYKNIKDFVEEYLLDPIFSSQQETEKKKDYLIISTIHSAKGTENEIVYISDVTVGRYPSQRDMHSLENIEEERRVLYVAMTRAKKELIITRNTYAPTWEDEDSIRLLQAQYFLKNLPENIVKEKQHKKVETDREYVVITEPEEEKELPNKYRVRFGYNPTLNKKTKEQVILTDKEIEIKKLYECSKITISPLLELISKSRKPKNLLTNEIGVGKNYLDNLNKQSKPLFETIKKFADYFEVSPEKCFEVIKRGNTAQDNLNKKIVEYMKKRKPGDIYPKDIKEAVISEYVQNVYGFKKIGAKYGITPDVIKGWYSLIKK